MVIVEAQKLATIPCRIFALFNNINSLQFVALLHQPRSTREIADQFACTTRALYHHFSDACDRREIKKTSMT
jgi:hypothetical protein